MDLNCTVTGISTCPGARQVSNLLGQVQIVYFFVQFWKLQILSKVSFQLCKYDLNLRKFCTLWYSVRSVLREDCNYTIRTGD